LPAKVSDIIEEHLETIYRLQERGGVARTSDIVRLMNVAPGTVTNTVERLEKELLVLHKPYKGVQLTERGRRIALSVIRRHRLLERLLTDLLNIEWDKSHAIACKLEHWINEDVAKKIEQVLNNPRTCPHGNPIPTEHGRIFEEKPQPLVGCKVGERIIIAKIIDEKAEFLQYLNKIGIKPQKNVEVVNRAPLSGPITIKIDGEIHALSRGMASLIMVRKPHK